MTPRSSCPGGVSTPLQSANLRLNYEINNVTDTALGNLAGATIILAGISRGPQLQTAWVTFGKQRRVNSGARRSRMVTQQAVRLGKSAVRPLQHLGQQSSAIQNLFFKGTLHLSV